MKVILNSEQNGIELKFDSKPERAILDALKKNGFRWHNKKMVWYAKNTNERMEFINNLNSETPTTKTEKVKKDNYSLWDMTRTENIGNNVDKDLLTKEIAARIRKHLRSRFPMCDFSVTSDYSSIYAEILSSPFDKNSQELAAIVEYVYKYAESYKYCTCYDPYGDYGSSYNFFGVYKSNIISYRYKKREMTVSELNIAKDFTLKKKAFQESEKIRQEKELQEQIEKDKQSKIEAEKQRRINQENHDFVENNIGEIKEVDYFILDVIEANCNKLSKIDEYFKIISEDKYKKVNCRVTKEVYFTKKVYDIFANQLMDEWSFVAETGGSRCDDLRINSMIDYEKMSEEEKQTVEWYSNECVAIFCEEKLMFVVDAQGYLYCRYVLIPDDNSSVIKEYKVKQSISEKDKKVFDKKADILEEASVGIIINNSLADSWNNEKCNEYKSLLKQWIYDNKFKLDINIVRAITNEDFKKIMYCILTETDGIQEQFDMTNFESGQKITMIYMSDFGGMVTKKCTFKSYQHTTYAQYSNAVKLIFRPENKRNDYEMNLYKDILIYNGWIDYTENLLWEQLPSSNGMSCKRTKFMSCDRKQYDVILEYFLQQGIKPIINTYKPIF